MPMNHPRNRLPARAGVLDRPVAVGIGVAVAVAVDRPARGEPHEREGRKDPRAVALAGSCDGAAFNPATMEAFSNDNGDGVWDRARCRLSGQYIATATSSNGRSSNVTSAPLGSLAIRRLRPSHPPGLVSGIAAGEVEIRATYQGVNRVRRRIKFGLRDRIENRLE